MDAILKWLGGGTVAAVAVLGALAWTATSRAGEGASQEALMGAVRSIPARRDSAELHIGGAIAAKMHADADKRAAEALTIKRILPIEGPMKYGEWHWDTEGAPATGGLVVTVDLDARVISVFRDGYEIGAAVAMLGTDEHPTPTGTFPILSKQRHNVSEKYGNAPMPWSLFLTREGVAIHGGSEVENGYASHGCIAVPDPFADRLFAAATEGDFVVITKGKRIGLGDSLI
ncbi:MAG: L,D-transpeptidase family protein [Qipengyuania sp.]